MKQLREEAIAQVQHVLAEVLQEADGAFRGRAETLVSIAEHFHLSITDALLPWIRVRHPEKQWSGIEWRHWCEAYTAALAEARQELLQRMLADTASSSQSRSRSALGVMAEHVPSDPATERAAEWRKEDS